MADVLKGARTRWNSLWAVDKLILVYLAGAGILIAANVSSVPDSALLLVLHAIAAILILLEFNPKGLVRRYFRYWYPLPLVSSCYREMAILIPAIRHWNADRLLADLDYSFWHANPTVWMERIQGPALSEFLQLVYTAFVPVVLLVPLLLWKRKRFADFRYCAFLISLGFLASYIGYLLVPARGPRFLLDGLQDAPLHGIWLFQGMRATLDRLESFHYDCFPSGHTELTILALWLSRKVSLRLFWAYLAYTPCIIFATVYLRYHYTVDLLAGTLLAAVLLMAAPALFRKLAGSEESIGS